MTSTATLIGTAVDRAVKEVAAMLPPGTQLPQGPEAPLLEAEGGPLDSLGVVNLMVAAEGAVNEALGTDLSLAEFLAEPPESSPFRSRRSLQEAIVRLLSTGE